MNPTVTLPFADVDSDVGALPGSGSPGGALPGWRDRPHFTVLDGRFDDGRRFLDTWAAWRADARRSERLTYIALDPLPWRAEDLRRRHGNGPHAAALHALLAQWPLPCRGPHALYLDDARVQLLLWRDEPARALAEIVANVDATLCAAALSVPAAPHWTGSPVQARGIAVLGAGLAGCAVARSLARQGVAVTVIDPAARVAAGASAAPRMVVRPWLTRHHHPASTLSRIAFLHAVREYAGHPAWQACGVQQRNKPGEPPARMQAALTEQGWPPTLMQAIGVHDDRLGWFEAALGGALDPRNWCESVLQHPLIRLQLGHKARVPDLLAAFDAVVVACAGGIPAALGRDLPMTRTRGQTTTLTPGSLPPLSGVRCGDGYVAPLANGAAVVGATYDRHDRTAPDPHSDLDNLGRLERLTGVTVAPAQVADAWVAFRAAWPDRLPAVGPVDEAGRIWVAGGYASRGAVWAPLLGDVVAAGLLQRPIPLGRSLLRVIDARRFMRDSDASDATSDRR